MSMTAKITLLILAAFLLLGLSITAIDAEPAQERTSETAAKSQVPEALKTQEKVSAQPPSAAKTSARVPEPLAKEIAGQSVLAKVHPQIDSVFTVPVGALRPGAKLYLNGAHFGKYRGKILLYRYSSPIELVDVHWTSEEKVNGVVPEITKAWKNQEVTIKVLSADKHYSNPMKMGFVAREEAVLDKDDVAVLACGGDASRNICNRVKKGSTSCSGDKCDSFGVPWTDLALTSRHCVDWGASEENKGIDRYRIRLKNGWVFRGLTQYKTASYWSEVDLEGPYPRFPTGKSEWTFEYNWEVSSNDDVCYALQITVEGPVGTWYK